MASAGAVYASAVTQPGDDDEHAVRCTARKAVLAAVSLHRGARRADGRSSSRRRGVGVTTKAEQVLAGPIVRELRMWKDAVVRIFSSSQCRAIQAICREPRLRDFPTFANAAAAECGWCTTAEQLAAVIGRVAVRDGRWSAAVAADAACVGVETRRGLMALGGSRGEV